MVTALLYGIGTALPLLIGAAIGLRWKLPHGVLGALMAFGAGTMIAAASEELFGPAFKVVDVWVAGIALMAGAGVYVVADHFLDERLGAGAVGWGLMLGTLLDGVPENTALGVTLSETGGIVLLVAIAVGNMPEAIGSASTMRTSGHGSARNVLMLWAITGVLLVLVTVGADAAAQSVSNSQVAVVQAFAGGATIAVLADTLMPEAFREGGWWVGLATALGFFTAFVLGG